MTKNASSASSASASEASIIKYGILIGLSPEAHKDARVRDREMSDEKSAPRGIKRHESL